MLYSFRSTKKKGWIQLFSSQWYYLLEFIWQNWRKIQFYDFYSIMMSITLLATVSKFPLLSLFHFAKLFCVSLFCFTHIWAIASVVFAYCRRRMFDVCVLLIVNVNACMCLFVWFGSACVWVYDVQLKCQNKVDRKKKLKRNEMCVCVCAFCVWWNSWKTLTFDPT